MKKRRSDNRDGVFSGTRDSPAVYTGKEGREA